MKAPSETCRVNTVVIGAGQAGLSAGYHLKRHGVDFVIGKPFDVAELIATVNRAIDAAKSRPKSGAAKTQSRESKRTRGGKKPNRGSGASPSARLRT